MVLIDIPGTGFKGYDRPLPTDAAARLAFAEAFIVEKKKEKGGGSNPVTLGKL
jgi:hypothetical protein